MSVLLTTILSAAVPLLGEVFKKGTDAFIGRFIGGIPKPASVDEYIKMVNADTERVKAMATIDAIPDGMAEKVPTWVVALRASTRYLLAWVVIVTVAIALFSGVKDEATKLLMLELAGSVWGFLFGERIRQSWIAKKTS